MAAARRLIEKNPKNFEAYNALALALSRRARETSDVAFYAQAQDALGKSFEISPANFDGERTAVWLLLGRHEFPAALEKAKELNKKAPDDVMLYGFLTDANVETGNYDDAEKAAQWMLDLRPGNLPGTTRAAYLRELFGDVDGALELMNMAYQSTPPGEAEDRAWTLSQIGHLQLTSGKISDAETSLQQALAIFRELGERYGETCVLNGLGHALAGLDRQDDAIARHREALALATEIDKPEEQARARAALAWLGADRSSEPERRASP